MQVSKEIVNGDVTFHITWPSTTISPEAFIAITKWIRRNPDYAPMTESKAKVIRRCVDSINKTYNDHVTFDQLVSIRHIMIKSIVMERYKNMEMEIEKIAAEYKSGADILVLSRDHNYPPLGLLYSIFITNGIPKADVYDMFKGNRDLSSLSVYDREQYDKALEADAQSTFNQDLVAKVASDNENTVVKYFKSLGIGIKDESQLIEEQIAEHGRAVNTPDILFTDPVYINDVRTYWLDYKDYIGTKVRFLYKSNVDQACRYFKEWGQGALCFHQSYIDGLSIPGAVLLDARVLPIELQNI